jgi:hypothetical protein
MCDAVLEVSEYSDGPRAGVALLQGIPHRFRSRYLDATQYSGDFEAVDIFELTPLSSPDAAPILAHGTFYAISEQCEPAQGVLRKSEVLWRVIDEATT